jgi:hypothetical protein
MCFGGNLGGANTNYYLCNLESNSDLSAMFNSNGNEDAIPILNNFEYFSNVGMLLVCNSNRLQMSTFY